MHGSILVGLCRQALLSEREEAIKKIESEATAAAKEAENASKRLKTSLEELEAQRQVRAVDAALACA